MSINSMRQAAGFPPHDSLPMLERDLQKAVIDLARIFRWSVAHFRPAQTSKGWRTPVEADGKGWPDLLMTRDDRIVAVELKVGRNKLSPEQEQWRERLMAAGVEYFVWHEDDLRGQAVEVLR